MIPRGKHGICITKETVPNLRIIRHISEGVFVKSRGFHAGELYTVTTVLWGIKLLKIKIFWDVTLCL
jgi:hypothetical protein